MPDPRSLSKSELLEFASRVDLSTVSSLLDSTLLNPTATRKQIVSFVDEAISMETQICVNECRVQEVVEQIDQKGIEKVKKPLIACVIGFPFGATSTEIKRFSTRDMLSKGVTEIDMVANNGWLKEGNRLAYYTDIEAVANEIASFDNSLALKVIIETCYLTDDEKQFAAATVAEIGAKSGIPVFVKTSTGFGKAEAEKPSGATIDDLLLIRKTIGEYHADNNPVGVKASGGIRSGEQALKMIIAAGAFNDDGQLIQDTHMAVRIGTSSAARIMSDFKNL